MKKLGILFTSLIIAFVFVGCDFGLSKDEDKDESCTATFTLVNDTISTIYFLYISPSSSDTWGANQLGTDILYPGYSKKITDIPAPETYDYKAVRSSDYAYVYNHTFQCTDYVWTLENSSNWNSNSGKTVYDLKSRIDLTEDKAEIQPVE
jgi:hypothetical protein